MRLKKLQKFLEEKSFLYHYTEEDGMGSIDFEYRGIAYHVWEFKEEEYGAESNVRNGGWSEDFSDNYEQEIIEIIRSWR